MRQVPIVTALLPELLDSVKDMKRELMIKMKLNVDCGHEGGRSQL